MNLKKISLFVGIAAAGTQLHAAELITNGGFETGDFTGWTVVDMAGGSGTWFVDSDSSSPLNGFGQSGPFAGSFFAVTDQTGPGSHSLYQSFTVPLGATSVSLSLAYFVNNDAGTEIYAGLDPFGGPTQHGTVDILADGSDPFADTVGEGVIYHVWDGASTTRVDPWHPLLADLTSFLTPGETYILRIGEADNQLFLGLGIDDVSITADLGNGHPVPEVQTYAMMFGAGLVAFEALRRRRAARA